MMDVTCDTRGFGGRNPVLLHHLVNAARGGVPLQFFDMRRVLKKVSLFVFELSPRRRVQNTVVCIIVTETQY